MMANWGCIMFVISVVPLSKLAEVFAGYFWVKIAVLVSVQPEDHGASGVWIGRPGNDPSLHPLRV